MATKTNVNFDIANLVVTPESGSAINLTETIKASLTIKDKLDGWQPGGARFAKVLVITESERGLDLQGGDCYKLAKIPSGTPCTVTGTIPDAKNGPSGAGALTFSLVNAIVNDQSVGATARKFGMGGVSFTAYSSDGTADPLTITEVAGT